MSDKLYTITNDSNAQFVNIGNSGFMGISREGNQVQIHNWRRDLKEVAQEIEGLIEHLSQSYPTDTAAGRRAVANHTIEQIEKKPQLKQKLSQALGRGGSVALKEVIDNPVLKVLIPMLEEVLNE